ncbi:hypothetical protein FRC19_003250 [Serendipita sp. 401]|nr:hypothetical protein FRC19_003250 [Serendipita sp. 401]
MRVGALLDDISSTRSSTTRQSQALDEIEQALAMACTSSDKEGQLDAFLMLQDAFETNGMLFGLVSTWLISKPSCLAVGCGYLIMAPPTSV